MKKKQKYIVMKLTNDEMNKVQALSKSNKKAHPTYRKGQLFFNALKELHPETADSITATFFDPFYDDGVLESCIKYLSD